MNFKDKIDQNLKIQLKKNKFIKSSEIKFNEKMNPKLSLLFKNKIDNFYDEVITYSRKMKLKKELIEELALFDFYNQTKNMNELINNFDEIRVKLQKLNSTFFNLTSLYNLYLKENSLNPQIIYKNIISNWEENLINNVLNERIKRIETERSLLTKKFFNKIDVLRKKQKFLNMFPNYLNYLWDDKNNKIKKKININAIKKYAKYLASDPVVEEISFQLGRRLELDNQIGKTTKIDKVNKEIIIKDNFNSEELVGIYESNSLEKMLSTELIYLDNDKLKIIFYKKFAEKKIRNFEYESDVLSFENIEDEVTKILPLFKKQGDVIICIDSSASMNGPFEFIAKSLLLGIVKDILNIRNRNCILINFSDANIFFDVKLINKSPEILNDFLEMSFNGGTDYDLAFQKVFEFMTVHKSNNEYIDLLMISDFLGCALKENTIKKIKKFQDEHLSFYGIQIGSNYDQRISSLFNGFWLYDPNDPFTCQKFLNNLLEYNKNHKNIIK